MKILFVHLYNPGIGLGGASKVVYELATAMQKSPNVQVRAAVNAGPLAALLREKNLQVYEIPSSKFQVFCLIKMMGKILKDYSPDIVHSHHRLTTFILDLWFKRGNRIVHTEHVLKRNRRFFYRPGHCVTAVSESLRRHLVSYYRIPEDRVRTIPNAADLRPPVTTEIEALHQRYPIASDQLTGLCIGRFEEQKGHCYLVEAVANLSPNERARFRMVLLGDGKLRAAIEQRVKTLGLCENFIFVGYTEAIPEWLQICDFLILPSLWEGMPRSVIEAFYAGKPVIATNIEGTADIVRNGMNGLLVEPRSSKQLSQALRQILAQPEKLKIWGDAALQTGREHSFEGMITRYQQVYLELLESVETHS